MKKWIACMLSALFLMPVGQLCANTNIFQAESVGRTVVVTLNPLLQAEKFYNFYAETGFPWQRERSFDQRDGAVDALATWNWWGRTYACSDTSSSPFCSSTFNSHYRPFAFRFLGGAIKNGQMMLGLGPTGIQTEKVTYGTYPRAIVRWRELAGRSYIASALQTTDTAISVFDQERTVESDMVFAEAPIIGRVYTWASAYGGIKACSVNPQTGLPVLSHCSLLETLGRFDQLLVTPNYDALLVHTTGDMWYAYIILPDGTLDATANQVLFSGGAGGAGGDGADAITATSSPQVAMLSSSRTGKVYSCDYPLSSGAEQDVIRVSCNELTITYDGSLVNMIRPEFLRSDVFVTAVDKKLVLCYGSLSSTAGQWSFSCADMVTLDQTITSVSSAISHTSSWETDLRSTIDRDYFVLGLARFSDTYQSNLLVCNTPDGSSGVPGECQGMSSPNVDAEINYIDIF